ncbi:hypothetical protein B0G81_2147 [Paraburkholderia sp. BL6665CI2N2]|nr:hypothetical protein B0G81_2147 [Paraburkholderia sp. BL6665CI2N2]
MGLLSWWSSRRRALATGDGGRSLLASEASCSFTEGARLQAQLDENDRALSNLGLKTEALERGCRWSARYSRCRVPMFDGRRSGGLASIGPAGDEVALTVLIALCYQLIRLVYPRAQQMVSDGKDNRADEQADCSYCDQTA